MARKITAKVSEELDNIDLTEFNGEGPATVKAEWSTVAGLNEALEAVNEDDVFPEYVLEDVRKGEAHQVSRYVGDDFSEYSFNSSEYHVRFREHDTGWKHSSVEFIGLNGGDYSEAIAFYYRQIQSTE